MRRIVEPEILDDLPSTDRRAIHSRGDLRRLNWIMGHAGILSRALQCLGRELALRSRSLRLVELGAGDGTLLLRIARQGAAQGLTAQVTLVDRQNLVSAETRDEFLALDWPIQFVEADVFDWLQRPPVVVDLMFANLFLHHFEAPQLTTLMVGAAARTNWFIACEPRRSPLALVASRCLGLLGCNGVTRHDAVVSVRAGFKGRELAQLWPANTDWVTSEKPAGLFSHCFLAKRNG